MEFANISVLEAFNKAEFTDNQRLVDGGLMDGYGILLLHGSFPK